MDRAGEELLRITGGVPIEEYLARRAFETARELQETRDLIEAWPLQHPSRPSLLSRIRRLFRGLFRRDEGPGHEPGDSGGAPFGTHRT